MGHSHGRPWRSAALSYHRTVFDGLRRRLDLLSARGLFLLVVVPLFVIYLATGNTSKPHSVDTYTNVLTAWNLAVNHTPYIDGPPELADPASQGIISWFVVTPEGHIVSQYPPGTALLAVPGYLIDRHSTSWTLSRPELGQVTLTLPSLVPAAVTTSLATALAIGLLALLFSEFVAGSQALVGAYIAGLGTGAWSVASNALWQHGPDMLWIALGLYLVSRRNFVGSGLVFGMAILTRPPVAIIAAAVGLAIGWSKRSFKPVGAVAFGSGIGLATVVLYNWAVFDVPSLTGGYGPSFTARALHSSLTWYLQNIAGALFDTQRGLFVWALFLVVLLPGLTRAWKVAPDWAKGATVGGLVYLLLQLKANRFSGGEGFFAYRYPLEALTALAPLLILSWREWTAHRRFRIAIFAATVLFAMIGQAWGSLVT